MFLLLSILFISIIYFFQWIQLILNQWDGIHCHLIGLARFPFSSFAFVSWKCNGGQNWNWKIADLATSYIGVINTGTATSWVPFCRHNDRYWKNSFTLPFLSLAGKLAMKKMALSNWLSIAKCNFACPSRRIPLFSNSLRREPLAQKSLKAATA